MKSAYLPFIALAASLAMLIHSTGFASECRDGGQENCTLEPGQSLPVLDIREGGEISVTDNGIVRKPWNSKSLERKGKVQVVQYVAANRSAVRQSKPFARAFLEKRFSPEKLDATVIVNTADTIVFTKLYVANKLAKNKAKRQEVSFVIDDNGMGLQRWGMKQESFAIIVLDSRGKVLFARDGPLTENEIEIAIRLIENQFS